MARARRAASPRSTKEAARIRHLLALDAQRVMGRLTTRLDDMIDLFSRMRTREPMLRVVATWFETISFSELSRLEPREQLAVTAFHRLLDELRWYVEYTEDMPSTVRTTIGQYTRRLEESHRDLTAAIGPPDAHGLPVVEVAPVRKR